MKTFSQYPLINPFHQIINFNTNQFINKHIHHVAKHIETHVIISSIELDQLTNHIKYTFRISTN